MIKPTPHGQVPEPLRKQAVPDAPKGDIDE